MRASVAAAAAARCRRCSVAAAAAPAEPNRAGSPPFVDHTEWAQWGDLPSLRVYPTPAGRAAAGSPARRADADEAWSEVLALAPEADTARHARPVPLPLEFAEVRRTRQDQLEPGAVAAGRRRR